MQITARIMPDSKRGKELGLVNPLEFTFEYAFGETLEENVAAFGKEAVNEAFLDKAVVAIQAVGRTIAEQIHKGTQTQEGGQAAISNWKLGQIVRSGESSRNPVTKAKALIVGMDAGNRAQLLRELQESLAAEQAA